MVHAGEMPYSQYGAFELKARYQQNCLVGIACTAGIGLIAAVALWVAGLPGDLVVIKPVPPAWIDHGPRPQPPPTLPHSLTRKPQLNTPNRGVIPIPIEGDNLDNIDTSVILSPHNYNYGDALDTTGLLGMFTDTAAQDELPQPGEYVYTEILPEIVHQVQPEYPVMAKRMGLTGTVTVQVLVGKKGEPLKAIVGRSSGWSVLDEAAVAGAFKNTYKPGIQNGRPVACWASYRVEFGLELNR